MNTANIHAGRLERRVRLVGKGQYREFMDFALFIIRRNPSMVPPYGLDQESFLFF